jgi:hypothetical protein
MCAIKYHACHKIGQNATIRWRIENTGRRILAAGLVKIKKENQVWFSNLNYNIPVY